MEKLSYSSIRDTDYLITANAASIEISCGGDHNVHLGLVLMMT